MAAVERWCPVPVHAAVRGRATPVAGDLTTRAEIDVLLRRFYGRALVDELLAEPFTEVREQGLESHLPVMCDFWETILFSAGTYRGSLFRIHRQAYERHPFDGAHFDRWLLLWREAVDELYTGPVADRAKLQGQRIATAMHRRLAGLPSLAAEAVRTGAAAMPTGVVEAVPDAVRGAPGQAVPWWGGHDRPRDLDSTP